MRWESWLDGSDMPLPQRWIWARVMSFTALGLPCTLKNDQLAGSMGISVASVEAHLSALVKAGRLERKVTLGGQGRNRRELAAVRPQGVGAPSEGAPEGLSPQNLGGQSLSPQNLPPINLPPVNLSPINLPPQNLGTEIREIRVRDIQIRDSSEEGGASAPPAPPQASQAEEAPTPKRKRAVFQRPTQAEVEAYIREYAASHPRPSLAGLDPTGYAASFTEYYEATGWHDAKGQSVKSWKGKLLTWLAKDEQAGRLGGVAARPTASPYKAGDTRHMSAHEISDLVDSWMSDDSGGFPANDGPSGTGFLLGPATAVEG